MRQRLYYLLERMLLRGARYRLAVIALLIAVVSLCGGLAVLPLGAEDLPTFFDSVWWAFLRMTDPGYLGDDHGAWRRFVSTGLTLCGYVLFMGALIAVMTQALDATLSRLERGETPIAVTDHLLVVGWTDRSAAIIREFLLSQRLTARFLARRGRTALQVVLMVDELSPDMQAEIIDRFGELWDDEVVILRAGSMLRLEHLERVAFADAAAIVLPGADSADNPTGSDIAVIKTLLSIASHPHIAAKDSPPRVVAEVFDSRKVPLARVAYEGGDLDVVPSDLHISRLVVQNLRNPGLSHVYGQLLTHHEGAEVYVRVQHAMAGLRIDEAAGRYDRAVLLGIVRLEGTGLVPVLSPPGDHVIAETDRLVFMADTFADTEPLEDGAPRPIDAVVVLQDEVRTRRVLVLGYSDKLAPMIREMGFHASETWDVTVVSLVPPEQRIAELPGDGCERVRVVHLPGDFTVPATVVALAPQDFDNVVLLGSDWLHSEEEADARTLVGYLTLKIALEGTPAPPHILVELTDPGNASLFDNDSGEVVVSPLIVSNLLAHVTLRAEVLPVFDLLFSAGGPSLLFRDAHDYGISGMTRFSDLASVVRTRGHIAVGVRERAPESGAGLVLAPNREDLFDGDAVDLVVMAPFEVRR